jgi:hydroxypyruvate reductase/glycerate 2-kinase
VPTDGISLYDIISTYNIIVKSNLNIKQINAIRKHLSIVKGGKFPTYTKAKVIGLYISDVPGNNLTDIGSGPTVEDSSTFKDCYLYLNESGLFYELPHSVQEIIIHGLLGEIEETSKTLCTNVSCNVLLGSNKEILKSLQDYLSKIIRTTVCTHEFIGNCGDISNFLYKYSSFPYFSIPQCFIWGGESTVDISKKMKIGTGGRNQELILHYLIDSIEKGLFANVILVSIGTDGIDGNSPNMGAYFDSDILKKRFFNLDFLKDGLFRHDSANTLPKELILTTGPTFSNVGDIILLLQY